MAAPPMSPSLAALPTDPASKIAADAAPEAPVSLAEAQAIRLTECAVAIDLARQSGKGLTSDMAHALHANLEVWVAIRTFADRDDCPLNEQTRKNLIQLSHFVAGKVFASAKELTAQSLDVLININLHIAEGLLEGAKKP
jgi:flagellar protein FlaF